MGGWLRRVSFRKAFPRARRMGVVFASILGEKGTTLTSLKTASAVFPATLPICWTRLGRSVSSRLCAVDPGARHASNAPSEKSRRSNLSHSDAQTSPSFGPRRTSHAQANGAAPLCFSCTLQPLGAAIRRFSPEARGAPLYAVGALGPRVHPLWRGDESFFFNRFPGNRPYRGHDWVLHD